MLAGGANRRFGGAPKGLETVGGQRVIDRVAAALRSCTDEVVLSSNSPDAKDWLPGVAVLRDAIPGTGGLAGVHAALMTGRDALVVAWDMPFVTGALLRAIVDASRTRSAKVIAPQSRSSHGMEPFCALYRVAVRDELAAYLRAGAGSAAGFLDRVRAALLPLDEVERLGDPDLLFLNVNTAADLARARTIEDMPR